MPKPSFTPGPWTLCHHLESAEKDQGCSCGYRGVIYGPEHDIPYAVCQTGHDPAPAGQEGLGPVRYPRDVELANARLIAAAPDYDAFARHVQWEVVMGALDKWTREGGSDLVALGIIAQGLLHLDEARKAAIAKATGEQP